MPISDAALKTATDAEYHAWLIRNSLQQAKLVGTMLTPFITGAESDREDHETRMWGVGWDLTTDCNSLPATILMTDERFDGVPFVEAVRKLDFESIEHIAMEPGTLTL
jgi:hypothetical protein